MKTIIYLFVIFLFVFNGKVNAQTAGEVGAVISIESEIAFQGYDEDVAHVGVGEYQIYYDNINGVLDKPLVILDGFDPNDSSGPSDIYNYYLSYGEPSVNILEDLRNSGVDIVVLNFPTYTRESDGAEIHGGADYIERNAYVLIEMLETVNAQMTGSQELVVVGPSMGGLISRYALAYMEQNAMDHNTGLWLSFDSPHRGANIPISLQYLVNYMAEVGEDENLVEMRERELNSPAAKQMLLDHYSSHIAADSEYEQDYAIQFPTPAAVFRSNFETALSAVGFPNNPRNISLVNGAFNGTMVESPGATVIDASLDLGDNVGVDIALYFTPDASVTNYVVDYLQPTYYGISVGDPFYAYASSPSYTAGIDSAPGGTVLFDNYLEEGGSGVVTEFLEALEVEAFSFIPVQSSMNVDTDNWYDTVSTSSSTTFDAFYIPSENQRHLTVTEDNSEFIREEIYAIFDITDVNSIFSSRIRLASNPVKDKIVLNLDTQASYSELSVSIYNMTGQKLHTYSFSNPKDHVIMDSPQNGSYFIRISDGVSLTTKKIIVQQ